MGNIIISIKRFFQNKNTVTIFAIIIAVGIIYFAYNYRIKKSTEPVSIPYATQDIGPRTLITSEMISTRKVPGGVVTKDVLTNMNNIIGKYVINTAVIPEGSIFYESMVVNWEELPTSPFKDIPDGQTGATINVDMENTYGNSIFPGNYIDLYYQTNDDDGREWVGKFIECIRVLDVRDSNGNSVFETNGAPLKPNQLLFNIDDKTFNLFKKIDNVGGITLFPVQRNSKYSEKCKGNGNNSETKIVGNEFQQFVEKKAVSDSTINGGKK